jgi:hypothetical protein
MEASVQGGRPATEEELADLDIEIAQALERAMDTYGNEDHSTVPVSAALMEVAVQKWRFPTDEELADLEVGLTHAIERVLDEHGDEDRPELRAAINRAVTFEMVKREMRFATQH